MSDVRTYRGLSARERLTDRKERLLAAALERFGGQGYTSTTIEMLCTDAKVSTRGFYECFDSRESLLRTLYERLVREGGARVCRALDESDGTMPALVRAGLTAYIGYMTEDARRARIAHVEVRRAGEPLHVARRAAVQGFAEMISGLTADHDEPAVPDVRRVAVGLVGAVQELLIDWVDRPSRRAAEEVIATAEYLFLAAFPPRPAPARPEPARS
ncbi:MAG TPA: TetR/AcrR family transcriptional regulator [Streptosporangiaceae bacterium]